MYAGSPAPPVVTEDNVCRGNDLLNLSTPIPLHGNQTELVYYMHTRSVNKRQTAGGTRVHEVSQFYGQNFISAAMANPPSYLCMDETLLASLGHTLKCDFW